MNFETNRLNTFANWPASAPVDPIRIAKAGFYYTGEGTEVQCFSCGGKISQWNYGDQVMWRHRHLEPNCEFLVNPRRSGNVPLVLGSECPSNLDSTTSWSSHDEGQNEPADSPQDYGVTEEDAMYRSDALRLLSFINWNDTSVSREALVNAGFYHAGEGKLRCAWCGGELAPFRRFGSLGPPLEVHRIYFPRCAHAASLEISRRNNSISPPSDSPSLTPPILSPPDTNDSNQRQSSGAEHNARLLESGGTWRSLGVVSGGTHHPAYASLAARLATFERWPVDRHQVPQVLAEAGFYYTGIDDQVRCFYCDGGLGKWEASDTPWSEHAHWFPHCGYVLLVKGQEFVDACRNRPSGQRTFSTDSGIGARRRNAGTGVNFPISESQVEACMESAVTLAALGAGLDAARVRRALTKRLRTTGTPFQSSEALIDAVLNEQLNEEAWSVSPQSQRLARDILAETLREFAPGGGIIPSQWDDRPESQRSQSATPPRSATPEPASQPITRPVAQPVRRPVQDIRKREATPDPEVEGAKSNAEEKSVSEKKEEKPVKEEKALSLEEENRQLKEARLCKVCMDSEVSVVFLPCGHLVSCARCGAALAACPLCRAAVRALVRAYLA